MLKRKRAQQTELEFISTKELVCIPPQLITPTANTSTLTALCSVGRLATQVGEKCGLK